MLHMVISFTDKPRDTQQGGSGGATHKRQASNSRSAAPGKNPRSRVHTQPQLGVEDSPSWKQRKQVLQVNLVPSRAAVATPYLQSVAHQAAHHSCHGKNTCPSLAGTNTQSKVTARHSKE